MRERERGGVQVIGLISDTKGDIDKTKYKRDVRIQTILNSS